MHTIVVAHQKFALKLVTWLQDIIGKSGWFKGSTGLALDLYLKKMFVVETSFKFLTEGSLFCITHRKIHTVFRNPHKSIIQIILEKLMS